MSRDTDNYRKNPFGLKSIRECLTSTIDLIEEPYDKQINLKGLSTGFDQLDAFSGGLCATDLIAISSQNSLYQSILAMNIGVNVATNKKVSVLFYSLHEPSEKLLMKIISYLGHIQIDNIESGNLDKSEWRRLTSSVSQLVDTEVYIDDTRHLTIDEIKEKSRDFLKFYGEIGLIILDSHRLFSRNENSSSIKHTYSLSTGDLKALATELDVPIVFTRNYNELDRETIFKNYDIGFSDSDVDYSLYIYRQLQFPESVLNEESVEVIVKKQRITPLESFKLKYANAYCQFWNSTTN